MRHLEVTVDQWQFGKDNTIMHRGQRFFEEDDEAARVWVGMGKAKYVDELPEMKFDDRGHRLPEKLSSRAMSTEDADALLEPKGRKIGKYNRRDMRARD